MTHLSVLVLILSKHIGKPKPIVCIHKGTFTLPFNMPYCLQYLQLICHLLQPWKIPFPVINSHWYMYYLGFVQPICENLFCTTHYSRNLGSMNYEYNLEEFLPNVFNKRFIGILTYMRCEIKHICTLVCFRVELFCEQYCSHPGIQWSFCRLV